MIIIRLQGGLGNQLFQYALYLELKERGREVKIDEVTGYEGDLLRSPVLRDSLGADYEMAEDKEIRSLRDSFMDPLSRIRRKLFGRKNKEWEEPDGSFYPEVLDMDDRYLNGYFQSERYFTKGSVRERLEKLFEAAADARLKTGAAGEMSERILKAGSRSVSLHIRRGDYLEEETAKTHGGICEGDYYEEAIRRISKEVNRPVFYIFSDDKEFAGTFAAGYEGDMIPVGKQDDDLTELLLMRRCRHHIMANSSFSWWGAWGGKGLSLVPDRWFNGRAGDAIYTDGMIRIAAG